MGVTNFDTISCKGLIGAAAGGLGVGNVYYVADTTSANYNDLQKRYGATYYEDGTPILVPHTSTASTVTTNGLKNAASYCVTDRNDYIVLMPSSNTYYIDEVLTLNKKAVHLVAPANMVCEVGCMNNSRIQQIGSGLTIISIENSGIEVAGLYLKNLTGYAHITVPTTGTYSAWGLCIHHNYFVSRSSSTTLPMLDCNGDGASYSRIEKNWFTTQVSSGSWTAGVIDIEGGAAQTDTVGNYIVIGDSGTAAYGIRNKATKAMIADNYFSECGTSTISVCVSTLATTAVIGNRCAVASTHFSDATGTVGVSYTDNTDGVTNAKTGSGDIMTAQLDT